MTQLLGREALGLTGEGTRGSLREAVAAGPGWGPALVLASAGGALLAQGTALLLAPALAVSLGREVATVGHLLGTWSLGAGLALPAAVRLASSRRRLGIGASAGGVTALGVASVALATGPWVVALGALAAGAGTAVSAASHRALLAERYPAQALAHVLACYRAGSLLVAALGLVVALPLVSATSLSWRAGLLSVAALLGASSALTWGLAPVDAAVARPAGLAETMRRLLSVGSVRPLLLVVAALTAAGFGVVVYGWYALTEDAGLPGDVVPWVLAAAAVLGALAVLDRGGATAAAARTGPGQLAARATAPALAAGAGLVVLGVTHWTPARLAGLAVAVPGLVLALVVVDRLLLLVVPPDLHGAGGAMATGYAAVVGVALGGALLSSVDAAHGLALALPVAGCVALGAAAVLHRTGGRAESDVDAAVTSLVEARENAEREARGLRPPLLSCRRVSFSYGPLQILFDVDFSVDEGEMVALLGTNGAGKSTLLRVISGLGTPSAGTVRVGGIDVTHAEPAERVRLGVTQIPGGKAVFGPLSVAENLRLYGYSLGRDRRAVERGVDEALAAFPRLAERRNAPASTMSGGEQQMLALSKALILKPRLLLIDELSLGLAPKVVGELLAMVRTINEQGAAVVLVEQSVNVALSLAEHAYFMEKGQVRFDGRTADLLARPDMLRSVFLVGAAAQGQQA